MVVHRQGRWAVAQHRLQRRATPAEFLASSSVPKGRCIADVVKRQLILSASINLKQAKPTWLPEATYSSFTTEAYLCAHPIISPLWGLYNRRP